MKHADVSQYTLLFLAPVLDGSLLDNFQRGGHFLLDLKYANQPPLLVMHVSLDIRIQDRLSPPSCASAQMGASLNQIRKAAFCLGFNCHRPHPVLLIYPARRRCRLSHLVRSDLLSAEDLGVEGL